MLRFIPTMIFFSSLMWISLTISALFDVTFLLFLLPLFLYMLLAGYMAFDISRQFYIDALCKFNTSEKKVALTFDDGPNINTEMILSVLKKYNVKATFFCIGKQIEKHPDIFKKIDSDGHLLGVHTYSHQAFFPFLPSKIIKKELDVTNDLFYSLLGKKSKMFRPPFGVTNPLVASGIKKAGLKVIAWSVRTLDTVNGGFDSIKKKIDSQISPGGIILLHDTTNGIELVLEQLILHIHSLGYSFVELDKEIEDVWYEKAN